MGEPVRDDLNGLGGWLILVGLGVVLSPFRLLYFAATTYPPIFIENYWGALTAVGSLAYRPYWGSLLIGEIVINSALVLVGFSLIYLFFSKHYLFPKVYIAVLVFSLVFIGADAWLVSLVLPEEPMFDPDTLREVARALGGVVVWVPYMLVSKRVRATFVRKMPAHTAFTEADLFT